jgi:hypothetical protein
MHVEDENDPNSIYIFGFGEIIFGSTPDTFDANNLQLLGRPYDEDGFICVRDKVTPLLMPLSG